MRGGWGTAFLARTMMRLLRGFRRMPRVLQVPLRWHMLKITGGRQRLPLFYFIRVFLPRCGVVVTVDRVLC